MGDGSVLTAARLQLGAHRRLLEFDVETLEEHIADVERDFNRRRRNLEQSFDRRAQGLSEQDKQELGDIYSDEFQKLEELFPTMHRRSYLLTTMSVLESYLNRLCKYSRNAKQLNVDVTDLRGAGIERALHYLRKVIAVQIPQSKEWTEISVAQVIRNLVVHNDGYLKDKSSAQISTYAKTTHRVAITSKNEVVLTDDFVPALLESIRGFADQLMDAMEKALENAP